MEKAQVSELIYVRLQNYLRNELSVVVVRPLSFWNIEYGGSAIRVSSSATPLAEVMAMRK